MNAKELMKLAKAYNRQFDYMIENDKYRANLDNWGSKERTERYNGVKDLSGQINYKGEKFIITHSSSGGCGMGSYPASATIIRVR